MLALDKKQIAEAFDKDEVLNVPDLRNVQSRFLDYFGWVHSSGHLGFIVLQLPNGGQNRGIRMRRAKRTTKTPSMGMCFWCHHVHRKSGTAMFTVSVKGSRERYFLGNVVRKDLDCSLRLRNLVQPDSFMPETLSQQVKVWRMKRRMHKWLGRANQL